MQNNYKRLGDYIQIVNNRNTGIISEDLRGLSMNKEFRKSTSNIVGTDLSKYKLVYKKQFACDFMSVIRVHKLPVVLHNEEKPVIVSPAYTVFEIIDTNVLSPEYAMMWFRRPEFDRYADFRCDSAIRGGFKWDELCDVKLPIPTIEKQQKIVNEYHTVVDRIKLNEQLNTKLEETAQALYKHWFVDFEFPNENGKPYKSSGGEVVYNEALDKDIPVGWEVGDLGTFGKVITGKTPSSQNPEDFGNDMPFVTSIDFRLKNKYILSSSRYLSKIGFEKLSTKILEPNSIVVTCIGSDMGKVRLVYSKSITNQQINSIVTYEEFYFDFLYHHLTANTEHLKAISLSSSTMPMLNKSDFEKIKILKPKEKLLIHFYNYNSPLNKRIINSTKQNQILTELASLLLARMGRGKWLENDE